MNFVIDSLIFMFYSGYIKGFLLIPLPALAWIVFIGLYMIKLESFFNNPANHNISLYDALNNPNYHGYLKISDNNHIADFNWINKNRINNAANKA